MSFAEDVKGELAEIVPEGRHCQVAELAGMYALVGDRKAGEEQDLCSGSEFPKLRTENEILQRKFFTLYKKSFMMLRCGHSSQKEEGSAALDTFHRAISHPMLLSRECCRRSFLRGAFLSAGSVSDPRKHYHFEIVCPDTKTAGRVQEVLASFGRDAKIVQRKKSQVVYLKEAEQIVLAIGEMGASRAFLEMENIRVGNELNGIINRQVNCDLANTRRVVKMSMRQVEDIEFIRTHMGFSGLPESLKEMARVRLENPEATLGELGNLLDPKIGKSGVNHRLRRLSEIAGELRKKVGA